MLKKTYKTENVLSLGHIIRLKYISTQQFAS